MLFFTYRFDVGGYKLPILRPNEENIVFRKPVVVSVQTNNTMCYHKLFVVNKYHNVVIQSILLFIAMLSMIMNTNPYCLLLYIIVQTEHLSLVQIKRFNRFPSNPYPALPFPQN